MEKKIVAFHHPQGKWLDAYGGFSCAKVLQTTHSSPPFFHTLTLMLLVANMVRAKLCEKSRKMTETLANWYSSDRAQQELSNEYQQDRVWMDLKHLSDFISCVKIAAALKGLN